MPKGKKFTDQEILEAIQQVDGPAATAVEIAERIDMTRQGVGKRLDKLVENDVLETKKPGRDRLYWLSN